MAKIKRPFGFIVSALALCVFAGCIQQPYQPQPYQPQPGYYQPPPQQYPQQYPTQPNYNGGGYYNPQCPGGVCPPNRNGWNNGALNTEPGEGQGNEQEADEG